MNFYLFLARLSHSDVVKDDGTLLAFRNKKDLDIITKILVPIMVGFTMKIYSDGYDPKEHTTVKLLNTLYNSWTDPTIE
jgi:hypothetical protein